MTSEELTARAKGLRADLAATAEDHPDMDPNANRERNAAAAFAPLFDDRPGKGRVRDFDELVSLAERLYHDAVAEAERVRSALKGNNGVLLDTDLDNYAYMAAHPILAVAHAANHAWSELTAENA